MKNRALKATTILGAGSIAFVIGFGVSGQMMVTAIAGDRALTSHMLGHTSELSKVTTALERQIQDVEVKANSISGIKERVRELYRCEVSNGCLSGRRGEGPTATSVLAFLSPLQETQVNASGTSNALKGNLAMARDYIAVARQAAEDGDVEAFMDAESKAISVLSEAQGRVSRTLFEGNPLLGSDISEIDQLARQLASVQQISLVQALAEPLPEFVKIDKQEAIQTEAARVNLAWLIAFCLEFVPMALLGLTILGSFLRQPESAEDDESGPFALNAPISPNEPDVFTFRRGPQPAE